MNSVAILGQAELPPDGDVALNIALFRTDSLAPSATRIGYQTLLHEAVRKKYPRHEVVLFEMKMMMKRRGSRICHPSSANNGAKTIYKKRNPFFAQYPARRCPAAVVRYDSSD